MSVQTSDDITVVIPAYNSARTVARAIKSARQQHGAPRVVVVDDGSLDDTASIARSAGATVLVQSNAGPAAARNHAIDASEGLCHLIMLDADDELAPDAVLAVIKAIARVPDAACVIGAHDQVDPHSGRTRRRLPNEAWIRSGRLDLPAEALGTSHVFCTTGLTLTRAAVIAGIRFDESLRFGEDRDLVFRAARAAPIAICDRVLVRKHDLADRLTGSAGSVERWLCDQLRLVEKHACEDPEVMERLQQSTTWVLKHASRTLGRRGRRVTSDTWIQAKAIFAQYRWAFPTSSIRWRAMAPAIARCRVIRPRTKGPLP